MTKNYPMDLWTSVLFWPMGRAIRAKSRLLKIFLVLMYPPWFLALSPITAILLLVSVAMAVWDEVNP
jgi:hypothetical protein